MAQEGRFFLLRINNNITLEMLSDGQFLIGKGKDQVKARVVNFCDLETQCEFRLVTNLAGPNEEGFSNEEVGDFYRRRDELDVAVISYCRGKSRHDLHARMRSALNGCYGPFAMAGVQAPQDEIRRQAVRSIQQLTTQILEIKERFLPELEAFDDSMTLPKTALSLGKPYPRHLPSAKGSMASTPAEPIKTLPNPGPVDQPLREFLGDDAAIMAGLNPFINDLT